MAKDTQSSTVLYTVSNSIDNLGYRQTKAVSLVWNRTKSAASLRVSLTNYGVQVPVGVGLAGTLMINIATEVDFKSPDAARAMACWIYQTVKPDTPVDCAAVTRTGGGATGGGSTGDPQVTPVAETALSFCITENDNQVCLAWNETEARAYYAVTLSGVEVNTPVVGARTDVDTTINCSAEIALENFTVARALACWIVTTVPSDTPFDCPGVTDSQGGG